MVIDTSALAAVLFDESDSRRFVQAFDSAPRTFMSSFTWFETAVVVSARKGQSGIRKLFELCSEIGVDVVPFDTGQSELAFDAWLRYGKGRHSAGLNLGDCSAYALSRTLHQPLLYKGEDFPRTDILSADP